MTTPQNMEKEIEDALQEWTNQGRTQEQVYGAANFMTGRGKKLVEDAYARGEQAMLEKVKDIVMRETDRVKTGCKKEMGEGIFMLLQGPNLTT